MTEPFVVLSALGSAMAAAASSVLQHRSARRARARQGGSRRLIARLLLRPDWLFGLSLGAIGLSLHAVALSGGRLAVVQPLLVCGVVFALPANVALERRRPVRGQWLWGAVLLFGMSMFLLSARPSAGQVSVDADGLALTTAAGALLVALLAAAGRQLFRKYGAVLLGAAAGVAYGITATLLKENTTIATAGARAILFDWPLYALIAMGGAAVALTQHAFLAGPLGQSLPAITVSDPAISVAIGALAFHEHLSNSPVSITVQIAGFALIALATLRLALLEADQTD